MGDAPHPSAFRLLDPGVIDEPWAYYAALHAHAPVWRDPQTGFYIVARYALIQEALRDPARFSAQVDRPNLRPNGLPAEALALMAKRAIAPTLVGNDPPSHDRFRPLVQRVFSAERVEALEPSIQAIADALVTGIAEDGRFDAVADLGAPLPLAVIADQLGVPRDRVGDLKRWSDAIVQLLGLMGEDEDLIACARAQQACLDYLIEQAHARRLQPDDTILSGLANGTAADGAPLTDAELASILVQLLVAGNETTTNSFGSGMLILARDPVLQSALRGADAKTWKTFIEEVLRLESAVQGHYRRAKVDLSLGDVAIPAGSIVHLRYGAGNRDETVFAAAATVKLDRANAMQHLAFGGGAHFCIGAMLARTELAVAFKTVVERLDDIRLDPEAGPLERFPSMQHRGLKRLPLLFTPRRA